MKVYFKNLDGIRFFAALMVLLQHSFGFKKSYSDTYPILNRCFEYTGRMGVNLFFILSGFLISYLLLVEKDSTGTVSFKSFYLRRILRIWPLYLGYGLILTFFSPYVVQKLGLYNDTDTPAMLMNLVFLLFFSVNFQLAFVGSNRGMFEISWSVCIEEQFYVFWPWVINTFRKKMAKLLVVLFGISVLARVFIVFILPLIVPTYTLDNVLLINYLLIFDKLDLFGGGLFAALLYYKREEYQTLFRKLFRPWVQILMTSLAFLYAISVLKPTNTWFLLFADHYACSLLFGYVLLAAVVENSIYRLENPLLKTLGRISFGIYLFHTAICQFVLIFFQKIIGHPESRLIYDLLYPFSCLVATSTVAYLSYTYYEMWFLKKKKKFELVLTRI
jgi:peptidoglycan/LPS O-acetylase OafA/YrhL